MIAVALLLVIVGVQVLSAARPAPPLNVQLDAKTWLMTWTPATAERDVNYKVLYTVNSSRFENEKWEPVKFCEQISSNSCNVASTKAKHQYGCVRLTVEAWRHGLSSGPAEACSTQSDTCIPTVNLTARPGTLHVHLKKSPELTAEYADHIKHVVFYAKEGEPLKEYDRHVSSVTINDLEVGQRYCVSVQYLYMSVRVGVPRCPQCVLIPEAGTNIIAPVVACFLFMVILIPAAAYVLIFRRRTIKGWLQPPCQIPRDFLLEPLERLPINSPSEERCDTISSITPRE